MCRIIDIFVSTPHNHPPLVLKNTPLGVNRRLNRISSSKAIFDSAKQPYQEALNKSGYKHVLEYAPTQDFQTKKKNRKRSVTWFNPPFSQNVKTRVGREFLSLLDTSFPPNNPLHKLFTRQTVKLSYRCMPNMAKAVSSHNTKMLREDSPTDEQPGCNCRGGPLNCPVEGQCLTDCVVYQATIKETLSGKEETYTGATSRTFKRRLYEHRTDMRNPKNRTKTSLTSHVWDLKDKNIQFEVSWKLKGRATPYNPSTRKCRLCLKEKHHILYKREGASLNKRSEIYNTCRHRLKNLLSNVKT